MLVCRFRECPEQMSFAQPDAEFREFSALKELRLSLKQVLVAWKSPIRLFKWAFPVMGALMCWELMSLLLHLTTMHAVWNHDSLPRNATDPVPDRGHDAFGKREISLNALDGVVGVSGLFFLTGVLWLRDLRLWVKAWTTASLLFIWKGILDYITDFPDSGGWDRCAERLNPAGVSFFRSLKNLRDDKTSFWREFIAMELFGLNANVPNPAFWQGAAAHAGPQTQGRIWMVRYCGDMILSGHTAIFACFLVALSDLCRKIALLVDPTRVFLARVVVTVIMVVLVCAESYMVVLNHFHYSADVVVAIVLALLIYTNAAVAIFTQKFVEWREPNTLRKTKADGMLFIPFVLIPFCCFHGYYEVLELDEKHVVEYQQQNRREIVEELHHNETASLLGCSTESRLSSSTDLRRGDHQQPPRETV